MTEQEPEDTCRPVEVDGEIIDVFGREEMTEEDRGHFTEIVRAAKRKAEADDRARFAEARQHGLKARHETRLARVKTLEVMQAEVVECNARHDWGNGEQVPFQTAIANLHGEVSEAWEAWRKWGLDDATVDAGTSGGVVDSRPPKPEGVGSEFADIFIRLLDNCATYGVDLRAEYERKIAYNRIRPAKHGGKRA